MFDPTDAFSLHAQKLQAAAQAGGGPNPLAVWRAFVVSIDEGELPDGFRPIDDFLSFEATTNRPRDKPAAVALTRRFGVADEHGDYAATYGYGAYLFYTPTDSVRAVERTYVTGAGPLERRSGGPESFVAEVEASAAFTALISDGVPHTISSWHGDA